MVNKSDNTLKQTTIWQNQQQRLHFAELTNVLYAREIQKLARADELDNLNSRLLSLPYYIERAAMNIVSGDIPIELDSQNGAWIAHQSKIPLVKKDDNELFFKSKLELGIVLPILLQEQGVLSVYLDSLDQQSENGVHLNQHGWFDFTGHSQKNKLSVLLKPTKKILQAASCGHQWRFGKSIVPRILSLREMLLVSMVNWKNVKKVKKHHH